MIAAEGTENIPSRVAVLPGVIMEIFLVPTTAEAAMEMDAVIWVGLSTVKPTVFMPLPNVTAVAPPRLVPETTTSIVCPCIPQSGLTPAIAASGMLKPPGSTPVPLPLVTSTSLEPVTASLPMVMLAVISELPKA